jgi:hypothetical protein
LVQKGEPYSKINVEWERITGKKPGKSTLSGRYPRLKANLATVAPEHVAQLLALEVEVTHQIEAEYKDVLAKKWARISKRMEETGIQSYPVSARHHTKNNADHCRLRQSRNTGRNSRHPVLPMPC